MPEGHTIVRWARLLHPLVGVPLEHVDLPFRLSPEARSLVGLRIASIRTHGKHLLFELSDGRVLHTHALMFGSWELVRRGSAFRKAAATIRLRLATRTHDAAFFSGPIVELLTPDELSIHPRLTALGPDLLRDVFDIDEARTRLTRPDVQAAPIGTVLLDQTVVAGIGNIFKSEALFQAAVHPNTPTRHIARATMDDLLGIARSQMLVAARGSGPIQTVPRTRGERPGAPRHFVYRRAGEPCLICRTRIRRIRQGQGARSTYLCPRCQAGSAGRLRLF